MVLDAVEAPVLANYAAERLAATAERVREEQVCLAGPWWRTIRLLKTANNSNLASAAIFS